MSDDDIVLSFHDYLLKKSDVKLLDDNEWINDRLIGFYFQYLEKLDYVGCERVVSFVSPEVAQCIKLTTLDDVVNVVDPLDIHKKKLILFPVNDCQDCDAPGGNHWSLLTYVREENLFYHYDSSNDSNRKHAKIIQKRVWPFLKHSGKMAALESYECVTQENNYDCGIHVICNTEFVCRKYLEFEDEDIASYVSSERLNGKRKWLKLLIMAQAERQS